MNDLLDRIMKEGETYGMQLNTGKCELMTFGTISKDIHIGDKKLKNQKETRRRLKKGKRKEKRRMRKR